MITGEYLHRNGETATPTEPGLYWFRGRDNQSSALACIMNVRIIGTEWQAWEDYDLPHSAGDLHGAWWGPVTPPWGEEE